MIGVISFSIIVRFLNLKSVCWLANRNILLSIIARLGKGQWLLQEYRGHEKEIALESVGVSLVVKDMYEGVDFEVKKE